jgi:hypothetical protein
MGDTLAWNEGSPAREGPAAGSDVTAAASSAVDQRTSGDRVSSVMMFRGIIRLGCEDGRSHLRSEEPRDQAWQGVFAGRIGMPVRSGWTIVHCGILLRPGDMGADLARVASPVGSVTRMVPIGDPREVPVAATTLSAPAAGRLGAEGVAASGHRLGVSRSTNASASARSASRSVAGSRASA